MPLDSPGPHELITPLALGEVATFRRWAVGLCVRMGAEPLVVHDIELMVSELATNVVRHAPRTPFLTARGTVSHLHARFEFDDLAPGPPTVARGRAEGEGGYGLLFVEMLSSAWGWLPVAAGGKTVWFTSTMR